MIIRVLIISILVGISLASLVGIVSYPKNPEDLLLLSVRFDDSSKLVGITKLFTGNQELESKIYNFNTKRYAVGVVNNFQYKCQWYDSILLDYFNVNDIMVPRTYNMTMSRILSIFFSGSWIGENVTRNNDTIQSDYWSLRVLSHNDYNDDLRPLSNVCNE